MNAHSYTRCFMFPCDIPMLVLVTFCNKKTKTTTTKNCQLRCLGEKGVARHWLNWPSAPAGLKCFWMSEQCFKVTERERQSNVMADCNECFPVGWTVTLWMAGDSRPWGERIKNFPVNSALRLISTDKACKDFSFELFYLILYLFVCQCYNFICIVFLLI